MGSQNVSGRGAKSPAVLVVPVFERVSICIRVVILRVSCCSSTSDNEGCDEAREIIEILALRARISRTYHGQSSSHGTFKSCGAM